jgi:endonuclease/exonuclease/phosphatase (EEP) superfamily protein YafD
MRALLRVPTGLGLLLGSGATALGFLAPWGPEFEVINHFRPLALAGAVLLVALAAWSGSRGLTRGTALLAAVSLLLALMPLAYRAQPARAGSERLKIVSLNLWDGNRDVEAAARFLEDERADVVVLQEAHRLYAALIERLKGTYPHAYCPHRDCSQALLTRAPPLEVGKEDVPPRYPLVVWARIPHAGRAVTVMGLHLPPPFRPQLQAEQADWLTDYLRDRQGPLVVAGDFNLTPFSWRLLRLLHRTGLRVHLVEAFSWPAHRWTPVVLIDNVLTTPDLGSVSARIGPAVGSDHRPIVAELAWR